MAKNAKNTKAPKNPAAADKAAKAGTAVAEGAAPEGQETEVQTVPGWEVYDVPVGEIKINPTRKPTDEAISAMAKSIRQQGLINPVVIGTDGVIVAGNTRFLAMSKNLGRKTVPCRVAVDPRTGEKIESNQAPAVLATIAENLLRTNLTPVEMSKQFEAAIKSGVADNAKELASKIGLSATRVTRILSIVEKGSSKVADAVAADLITAEAAATLIARVPDTDRQDELLKVMLDAQEGKKIQVKDVDDAAPSTGSGRSGKAGRKPSTAPIPPAALNATESFASMKLVKGAQKGTWTVKVSFDMDFDGENFVRFNFHQKAQTQLAKIDAKAVRDALEDARQKLGGK